MSRDDNRVLVGLLHEAARLEHCLLASYLYAACSLKSLPAEFATLSDGRENRRRAIQFERVRMWKQTILGVAHEEMLHLHYVECLIRALGSEPYLGLPERDPETGNWRFDNWKERIGGEEAGAGGTEVPIEALSELAVRRFVMYEATDALQDEDPFDGAAMDLFSRLRDFELDYLLESTLLDVTDAAERASLKTKLLELYVTLPPGEPAVAEADAVIADRAGLAPAVQFQSIADLYNRAILPLYQEAFHYKRVPRTDLGLEEELQDPNYAAEGFLPILPVNRDKNYDSAAAARVKTPIRYYRQVDEVIAEIVEEGEGQQAFVEGAEALLAKVNELGGTRAYLEAVLGDEASQDPTPDWLDRCQRIRLSHLYRFAITMVDLDREVELARSAGETFSPARSPVEAGSQAALDNLTASLAGQFNAVYLVLLSWLGRIYEIKTWESDRRRRMGIEMLAAWPMMSIAIRPFLELASFLPIDVRALFRIESAALPDAPLHARQLLDLYVDSARSQEINDRMDYYALHALSDVAAWAAEQRAAVADVGGVEPHVLNAIMARLDMLATLDEFRRQFPYREHGGYSDRAPDQAFQTTHPHGDRYEESALQEELFADTFVLRVRFAGRELVQLATDPDPPTDEVGCTGTHMLHAADGQDHRFDRSLVWQPEVNAPDNVIVRGPEASLPPLGVRVAATDLLVTADQPAQSGYIPLSVMSSSGAVQTQGLQQVAQVTGLNEIAPVNAQGIRATLLPKHGRMPFLNGNNHVVSQDGEPIDPFILALLAADGSVICDREIFNEGKSLLEMSPLQRLLSDRGPCGFDFNIGDIPLWALELLGPEERDQLANPGFPFSYLIQRAGTLAAALAGALSPPAWNRDAVDAAVSFAERLRRVAVPSGTTVGWLTVLLNYGHTISGELSPQDLGGLGLDPIPDGLRLTLAPGSRTTPNGRWFVSYTQGYMDTDALSALVYGEMFVPLTVVAAGDPVRFSRSWTFPPSMFPAVAEFATRFSAPFWAQFAVDGNVRTVTLADGTIITEELVEATDSSYTYTAAGVPGVSDYRGGFTAAVQDSAVTLDWQTSFTCADAASTVRMFSVNAAAAQAMTDSLTAHFTPTGT